MKSPTNSLYISDDEFSYSGVNSSFTSIATWTALSMTSEIKVEDILRKQSSTGLSENYLYNFKKVQV